MQKVEFLTVLGSFANLDTVQKILPSIIEETDRSDAALMIHDSTTPELGQEEKWAYLRELERKHGFFLILSTNMSMAHARNMCMRLGQELYLPNYIALMEDDHGFRPGFIDLMVDAMRTFYGNVSPNGMRYGLFSGCGEHRHSKDAVVEGTEHMYPLIEEKTAPGIAGGVNSCFRAAPTQHWDHVLRGYDTDEYTISTFQTGNLNLRNYHKGFTNMLVGSGNYMFDADNVSRGWSNGKKSGLWDNDFAASDPRSSFKGKE